MRKLGDGDRASIRQLDVFTHTLLIKPLALFAQPADVARLVSILLAAGDVVHGESLGGDRPQVVVTAPFDVLTQHLGAGRLDTGEQVSPATVRRLCCDAMLLPAVLGTAGQPLDLGRERRLFTGPLRRALVLRDGGCAFPTCDRPPRWCAGHHVVPWHDGGTTCLTNAVLLCGFHHRAIHQPGGWTVSVATDGLPTFIPPPWVDANQKPQRNRYHRRQ